MRSNALETHDERRAYQELVAQAARDWARWQEDHPNYCRACRGTGVGWAFLGSYDEPPDWEPCGGCYGTGYCPWCGWTLVDPFDPREEVRQYCALCGWEEGEAPRVPSDYGREPPEPDDPTAEEWLNEPIQAVCRTCDDTGEVVTTIARFRTDGAQYAEERRTPCPDCQARRV